MTGQELAYLEAGEQPGGVGSGERGERDGAVGDQLDQDAAGPDDDQRAEVGVADEAERQLDAGRDGLADQGGRAEPLLRGRRRRL